MANIDLNNLFKKKYTVTSLVDSDINLNKPKKDEVLFSDFKCDLEISEYEGESLNSEKTSNDIKRITNEESIINSLKNIISTRYYTRLLNPEMNFDLRSYLFEELTETKAYFIGYDISTYIPLYEPRIIIKRILVTLYYNCDSYVIDLDFYVPGVSKMLSMKSVLNLEGISFS